jgi:Uma2 family endonuclease
MIPTVPTAVLPVAQGPLLTAEEFAKLHGDEVNVELVKGRLVRPPMPGAEHGEVCSRATYFLMGHALEHDFGRVMSNDTFVRTGTNPDTYRGADVCLISYARLPKDQALPKGPLETAPDLVVEVRSPHDRIGDIQIKVGEYLNAGVSVVVVLDPGIDAATVYRQTEEIPQRFSNGDELTILDLLPGFAVPVLRFFA